MAEQNYTYRTLIEQIQAWAAQHNNIQKFGYGTTADISVPRDMTTPQYPYVFVNPTSSIFGTKILQVGFNLICMDLVPVDGFSNTTGQGADDLSSITVWKAQSDMTELVRDFVSYFQQVNSDTFPQIGIPRGFSVTPFIENFGDRVVGVTAAITVNIDYPLNNCVQS
jgi:hypothetical protein